MPRTLIHICILPLQHRKRAAIQVCLITAVHPEDETLVFQLLHCMAGGHAIGVCVGGRKLGGEITPPTAWLEEVPSVVEAEAGCGT